MKAFVLAESSTGYVYNWDLYAGRDPRTETDGSEDPSKGGKIVRNLVRHSSPGHVIYMDNHYTSPILFDELRQRQQGAVSVGTVQTNRRGIPAAIKENMRKTTPSKSFRNRPMLAVAWYDKKQVTLLSTVHAAETVQKRVRDKRAPGGFRDL